MQLGVVIQARMSSHRLPAKVLTPVNGKVLLQYLLEKLDHCSNVDQIIVATSNDISDLPIVEFCRQYGVLCYRGSLHNVASRFGEIAAQYAFAGIARINGDSPLLDYKLLEQGIEIFNSGEFDLVTNVYPRSYPIGQSIEIFRASVFRVAYLQMNNPDDLEHVTPYFYRNSDRFKLFNLSSGNDWGAIQLAVDTPADLKRCAILLSKMTLPHWEYRVVEMIELLSTLEATAEKI